MEKIEKSEWYDEAKEVFIEKPDYKYLFCFGLANCILTKDKQWLLVEDTETAPHNMYYKIHMDIMKEIYKSIRFLYVHDIHIMAGFYDKSLNTSIFDPIEKKTFSYHGLEFRFEQLRNLIKLA